MNNTQVTDDELWDYYSGLPNPMWYQQVNELEDEEFHRLRLGFLQHMKELRQYIDSKVEEGENLELEN